MSRLSDSIQRSIDEMDEASGKKSKPGKLKRLSRYIYEVVTDFWYDYPRALYCSIRNLYRNVVFFWPHILKYRDFDYHYSLDLFCDSLEHLAHGLKRWDNLKHSQRYYKRCLFASRQLRDAYDDGAWKDKSYQALSKANPIKWVPLKNGMTQMAHDYSKGEEYYTKMFKLIHKRTDKAEKEAKERAWAYIQKHIQHFWD